MRHPLVPHRPLKHPTGRRGEIRLLEESRARARRVALERGAALAQIVQPCPEADHPASIRHRYTEGIGDSGTLLFREIGIPKFPCYCGSIEEMAAQGVREKEAVPLTPHVVVWVEAVSHKISERN